METILLGLRFGAPLGSDSAVDCDRRNMEFERRDESSTCPYASPAELSVWLICVVRGRVEFIGIASDAAHMVSQASGRAIFPGSVSRQNSRPSETRDSRLKRVPRENRCNQPTAGACLSLGGAVCWSNHGHVFAKNHHPGPGNRSS